MAPQALVLALCLASLALAPAAHAVNVTKELSSPTKLPSFIPRCSVKDPNLKKCLIEKGNEVIPKLVGGYPPLHMPSLDPLVIDEIKVETKGTSLFTFQAHNIVLTGLANTVLLDLDADTTNEIYTTTCFIPLLQIQGDYEVDGRILILPIRGKGKANITFENATMSEKQPYKLVKRADGKLYHELSPSRGYFNTTRAHFHLDNLFNGDKFLGEQLNIFLNENWRNILNDLARPFLDAAVEVIDQFAAPLISEIPYDEIFLDVD